MVVIIPPRAFLGLGGRVPGGIPSRVNVFRIKQFSLLMSSVGFLTALSFAILFQATSVSPRNASTRICSATSSSAFSALAASQQVRVLLECIVAFMSVHPQVQPQRAEASVRVQLSQPQVAAAKLHEQHSSNRPLL